MNYIKEINAFYDWLETNSISDSAIVLWHALMHINNKAGWITEFAVAISTLETKTGLKKDAIIRARQRLKQAGRIDFRSRSGQQSAMYIMIPFGDCVVLNDTNCDTNRNTNRAQSATQTASINKLNYTKLDSNNSSSSAPIEIEPVDSVDNVDNLTLAKFIEKEFCYLLSSSHIETIRSWLEIYPEDMIRHAIKIAVLADKKSFKYVDGIILDWQKNNIKSMQDVLRAEEKFRNQKKNNSTVRTSSSKKGHEQNFSSPVRDLSDLVE